MSLNTPKKIDYTVLGIPAIIINGGVQLRVIDTPRTGLWGGTPECKLNSGFLRTKTPPISCTGGGL